MATTSTCLFYCMFTTWENQLRSTICSLEPKITLSACLALSHLPIETRTDVHNIVIHWLVQFVPSRHLHRPTVATRSRFEVEMKIRLFSIFIYHILFNVLSINVKAPGLWLVNSTGHPQSSLRKNGVYFETTTTSSDIRRLKMYLIVWGSYSGYFEAGP